MQLKMLYFAKLKDAFAMDSETLETKATNIELLLNELYARGGVWQEELATDKLFRVAVNQKLANNKTPLSNGDEIAIFPPVTGG